MRSAFMLATIFLFVGCATSEGPVALEMSNYELIDGDPDSDDGFVEDCADLYWECMEHNGFDVCSEAMDVCVEGFMEDVCEREECVCECLCLEVDMDGPQARERNRCRCRCRCRARIRGVCMGDGAHDTGAHTETESESETETETESEGDDGGDD